MAAICFCHNDELCQRPRRGKGSTIPAAQRSAQSIVSTPALVDRTAAAGRPPPSILLFWSGAGPGRGAIR
eukprot:scaffold3360_cov74-Skeletonema_marinoi.AAC.2